MLRKAASMLPQYAPTRFLRVPSGNIFNKFSRPGLTSLFSTLADTGLVECVPNFSEGRDEKVIEAIAEACRGTPGCSLLEFYYENVYRKHRVVF